MSMITLGNAYKKVSSQINVINKEIYSNNLKTILKTAVLFTAIFSLGYLAVITAGTSAIGFLAYQGILFSAGYLGMAYFMKKIYEKNITNYHNFSFNNEKILVDSDFSSKIQKSFEFNHDIGRTLLFPYLINPIELAPLEEVEQNYNNLGWFA